MSTFTFTLKGNLAAGGVTFRHPDQEIEVIVEGEVSTRGCGNLAIADAFGVENIVTALGCNEVLPHYPIESLVDYLINHHESELESIINELSKALG